MEPVASRRVGCDGQVPVLTTPRLELRPVTVAEAHTLHAGEPPDGWTFAAGYPLPDTRDGVAFLLRHGVEEFGFYLVVRREDDHVVGEIGFVGPPRDGAVTIGYAIVPSARRQGFATEAIGVLCEWALAQPDVLEIRAQTLPDNEPSVRALVRAGFAELEPGPRLRSFSRGAG
jgi:RimJ/RimL family protein N-acetyltransferase